MAGPTWAQARANDTATGNLPVDTIEARLKDLMAVLASGQNPDGSAFALPVSSSSSTPDVSATGTISANTAVSLVLSGQSSVTVQDVNTGFTGTLNFEGSNDGGTTWFSLAVWPVGTTASGNLIISNATVTETANHLWEGNVAALSNVRVRGSAVSAGTAAVTIRAGLSTSSVVLDGPLPSGANVIGHVIHDTGSTTAVTGTVATIAQPSAPAGGASANVALAAATAITSTVNLTGVNARSLVVVLNTATASGGNTVQVTISGVTASGYVYPLLVGLAVASQVVTPYRVGPGLTPSANAVAVDVLPASVRIVCTVVGTVAYGVDYILGT